MNKRAFVGAHVFDGAQLRAGMAVLVDGDVFSGAVEPDDIPDAFERVGLSGGVILPGFVDCQANGGGGILFNDQTHVAGLRIMAQAHLATGTRAFLPTLITDTPDKTRAAVDAVETALDEGVPGIVGLHLEGPHLSVARKGAHDPALIRRMGDADEAFLLEAAGRLPNLMVTVAPESVTAGQIERLSAAGVVVSLGHSDCSFDQAAAAIDAGVRCVTHLFNAMSPLGSREPGLVGAALQSGKVSAGLIADGVHVHPATIKTALSAKAEPGRVFLVTDAMATLGSEIAEFTLNGRRIVRDNGRLTLEDGTLAGADLEMATALSVLIGQVGVDPATAYAMATSIPAGVLTDAGTFGHLTAGSPFNGVHLGADFSVSALD